MTEFREWPKIPRGTGEVGTITAKIDGTNGCIIVEDRGYASEDITRHIVGVQSRNRMLAEGGKHVPLTLLDNDNYGFANWVIHNQDELVKLGPGYHYGEWAGPGIQSNPLNLDKKRFFLFNVGYWRKGRNVPPECCDVVPILYEGVIDKDTIETVMSDLNEDAFNAGYTPEGVVVYYHKTKRYEKYTFKNQNGKWAE